MSEGDKSGKLAIIMRGLPGSGKSHWVEQFILTQAPNDAIALRQRGIFSTDALFIEDGEYRFDVRKLSQYHQQNLTFFIQALSRNEPIVICDNTNMAHWEFMAYEAAAKALGYQVRIVLIGDPTDSAHQQLCARRNRHGVPIAQIRSMAAQFQAF
ncbi:ATP-binding protein [Shewanella colwelliana]|uniref:ATP-binding protein n=1 Tax=Shewanella colwelliana TaxID=23 RepID=UPI0022B00470|nr:ATP-binding protein [Shewanella colwelliana]MCZ4336457.1 ATP-binding protein [Shewanella colwelliana]